MIIGFDASRAFSKEPTGTENYSYKLLEAMLSIDTENEYYIYTRRYRENKLEGFSQKIKLINIPNNYFWTQIGLSQRTFVDPIDVLFVPAHTIPLIRRPGLPVVMTVHDLGSEYLPASHQLKQRLYLKFITRLQLKTAAHLIAVSEATKDDLIKISGVKKTGISVIYEGVNFTSKDMQTVDQKTRTLCNLKLKNDNYFLFVGTIQPRKNLIRLIEAFSLFLIETKNLPADFSLVIAGKKGWDYQTIIETPQKLGIRQRVNFVGRVDDSSLAALYQGALGLVYPSLFEGFGLPILEAYFFGCPVLTSNRSSMPEIAGKGAILVDPSKVNAIMEGMIELFQNPAKRQQLIKDGHRQLQKFSWEKAAQETIAVLKQAVEEAK